MNVPDQEQHAVLAVISRPFEKTDDWVEKLRKMRMRRKEKGRDFE
jgi:hypothetical protein